MHLNLDEFKMVTECKEGKSDAKYRKIHAQNDAFVRHFGEASKGRHLSPSYEAETSKADCPVPSALKGLKALGSDSLKRMQPF